MKPSVIFSCAGIDSRASLTSVSERKAGNPPSIKPAVERRAIVFMEQPWKAQAQAAARKIRFIGCDCTKMSFPIKPFYLIDGNSGPAASARLEAGLWRTLRLELEKKSKAWPPRREKTSRSEPGPRLRA